MPSYLLTTTNFPLFSVNVLDSEHVVLAGGGGASKTGVPNAIGFYKLEENKKAFEATSVHQHMTGSRVPMNVDIHPKEHFLVSGLDHLCQLIEWKCQEQRKGRGSKLSRSDQFSENDSIITKTLNNTPTATEAETENDKDNSEYQKCVRFSPDGHFIVTGNTEGEVWVLKFPSLEVVHKIKGHTDEIDDLDVDPKSKKIVTASRDGSSYVWGIEDGEKKVKLMFTTDQYDDNAFQCRNIRFSHNVDSNKDFLYSTHLAKKAPQKGEQTSNYLVKWDVRKWVGNEYVALPKCTPTSLAVSNDGRYVAVGTSDGSVLVYISWSLQLLHHAREIHNIFVTDLCFLPITERYYEDLKMDCAVFSVSVDNSCHMTVVPRRRELPYYYVIALFVLVLSILLYFISMYDVSF